MKKLKLEGKRFGKLVAIKPYPITDHYGQYWVCHCDCGKEVAVRASYLKSGHTKSCGCSRSIKEKKEIKMGTEMKSYLDAPSIPIVSKIFSNRKRSNFVKWLLYDTQSNNQDFADILGIDIGVFNCKMHRNNFSFDELLRLITGSNKELLVIDKDTGIGYRFGE